MSNNVNIVNNCNWFQKMSTIGTQNVTNMVLSGTNPSTQMTLINSANDVHYLLSNYQLSKTNGFTLSFQFYITATNINSICAYFGVTDPTTNFDANGGLVNQTGAVELRIAPNTPIFQLYTNYGSNTVASTSSTSVTTSTWQTVTITYTPSTTSTWVVNYNGTNIINYNDSSYTTFASNQNTNCGIYGATSNSTTVYIRNVDLSVKQSIPMSVIKNTYSFYPEECFINKLSTYSQNNVSAAFGIRLLKSDYLGPVINIRRGSDNSTLDFYADSKGNVGTTLYGTGTTLLSWLAGSIGYVTRWYDQSGNGRDVFNTTSANQPSIGGGILDNMSSSGKSAARGIYALYPTNSSYTGATIKIRRSSDNATSDFYSDVYGNMTTSTNVSFSSWIGSSTAYVDTWYDQSSLGNHATQSTTSFQPIYNDTLKLVDSQNSSTQFLNIPSNTVPVGTANAPYSFVFKHGTSNSSIGAVLASGVNSTNQANTIRYDNVYGYDNYWYNTDFYFSTAAQRVTGNTVAITYNGSLQNGYVNNTLINSGTFTGGTTTAGQQYLFRPQAGTNYLNGQLYSVFVFGSSLSDSDRIACTANPTDLNIKYNGSTNYLYNGTTNLPLSSALKTYTFVFSGRPNNNTSSNVAIDQWSSALTASTRAALLFYSNNMIGFTGQGNDALSMIPYSSFINRKDIMMCNHNLSTNNITINDNGSIYSATTGSPSTLNVGVDGFAIGRRSTGTSEFFTGNINEVIVFRNTLTTKESDIYFTPNAISRKNYRSIPRLQIKDISKDNGVIPTGAIVQIDSQMLANLSPGAFVTSWNGLTGFNSPVLNDSTYNTSGPPSLPPYVSFVNGTTLSSGTGQYFDAGTKSFAINTNGGFTAIWYGSFTSSSPNANERIFDFSNGAASDNLIALRASNTTILSFLLFNGATSYTVSTSSGLIVQNEYAIWAFRYTASSKLMEILKNGVLLGTTTAGAAITDKTLTKTYIGKSTYTSSVDFYSNINTIGLYVYDRFLTDIQVASLSNHLMNCNNSSLPSILPDYNNKIVRYGSVLSQGYRNGKAMYFNGNLNSYLDIQDIPNCPLTFCFWFYNINSIGATSMSPAALCSSDLTGFGIQFDIGTSGTNLQPAYSTTGSTYTAMTTQTITLNTWYHIAFTVTPTTLAYYLNGTLIQSVSVVIYNTNRLVIGKSGDNGRPFNGYIQDLRVYDYSLRADEINTLVDSSGEERALINYNTPANYLVNMYNYPNVMNLYQSGSYTAYTAGSGSSNVFYQLTNTGVANSSNTLFNSTRIQNYNSFICTFDIQLASVTDHGFYFYCGATSSTTVPSGTVGTSANSSYYFYFSVTGTKGIYLFNDQGQQLSYSPVSITSIINSTNYFPITIIYNRSAKNTWTINVSSNDVFTYNDPLNANWVSNISGDFWGIGARTTTSGMYTAMRRIELTFTPYTNSVNTVVNAQNNTKFPPSAMTAASTTFIGTSILDGVYTVSASNSTATGINPYSAFDNNTSTYWGELTSYNTSGVYTGGLSTSVTNVITGITTSYSGEWLQIQVPNAITLNSFGLMGRQDSSLYIWRTPTTFYVAGSNDGSTWYFLHSTSGAQFGSAMQYFTCNGNNINKYTFFRLIASNISNAGANGPGGPIIDIAAWDLYTQMKTVNSNIIVVPPYSMTSNTTTFAGNSIYDGTYTLTSSHTNFPGNGGDLFNAFDNVNGANATTWSPGSFYNSSTGVYTGSTSTTVSSVSQSGEWLQIALPNLIVLYSFSLSFFWTSDAFWAKSFLIAGSNDNSTWTNIYDNTSATFVYNTAQTFIVTGSSIAYKYFRLIVRSTSGGSTCAFWFIDQWKLYTNASNFNLMKFPPAPLTADSPVTFTTVNQKNWYNVMSYGITSGSFTPVLSGTDPLKQLRLTDGTTSNITTYCTVSQTPTNYSSFILSFQLYATNVNNGEFINLSFGGGGYVVQYLFEIASYQGIRMNTSSVANPVVSATNWYNSTWNDIRIVYNRGGTNTWTMFFNETQILQYSDPNWANVFGNTWGFQVFNTTTKFDSYIRQLEMTINPVSIPGNSLLNGSYISSSSSNFLSYTSSYAFNDSIKNTSNITMWHSGLNYSSNAYIGSSTTTVSGTSYSGEWLQLQTPSALQLISFSIYPRQDSSWYVTRSPKNFVMAGSNDNSTWFLLHTATGIIDWTASEKYFICNGNNVGNKYSYFRLVVMLVNTGTCVNIQNLNLFTPMSLNNSVVPATPKGLLDGLTWKYFDGNDGNVVSFYTSNTYINIGRCVDTTNMTKITNGQTIVNVGLNNFSMEIFGYFRAVVSGTYTFSIAADDRAYFWIGSNALVGYTTSNTNITNNNGSSATTCTVTLLSGIYYPLRIQYTQGTGNNDLQFSFTPPGGTQTFNGQGYFFSGTGLNSAFPQENAKIIKDITNTNIDGIYYILVNGVSTPIYCLMNDCYDGGGWMMLMKGGDAITNTFQYTSNYWTSKNTLNAGDTTRNNADAKYDTFNYNTVKDVLCIWPDISPTSFTNPYGQNGGSIFVSDGWTWIVNNWNETTRLTPFTGFTTSRFPHQNTSSIYQTYGINNPSRYNGYSSNLWATLGGAYVHGFNRSAGGSGPYVRWGFLFSGASDLSNSNCYGGIGCGGPTYNISAGNVNGVVGFGQNRRFELYGR